MSSQTFLDENPPMILDATCSTLRLWPKKATIRIDIRPEVKPDMVMDARELQFPDHTFDEIYCDPPHVIDKRGLFRKPKFSRSFASRNRNLGPEYMTDLYIHNMARFGVWKSRGEWLDFVKRTDSEFYRCLKSSGELHYKICESGKSESIRRTEIDGYAHFIVTKEKITRSPTGNPTYWLTMRPKP